MRGLGLALSLNDQRVAEQNLYDYTQYGITILRGNVEFEQAFHNMPYDELITEIYDQGWMKVGLVGSSAALIALVEAEFDKTQDSMDISKIRPNGILQLMTTTTRGGIELSDITMVLDSGSEAIREMIQRFEALWATSPELILTDATWANVQYYDLLRTEGSPDARRHFIMSWGSVPSAYDYLIDSDKSFYKTGNSPVPAASPSPGFVRFADGWFGVSGEDAYLNPTSPQEFKAKMDLMPPGERFALMRWDSAMLYPVQEIWITGATQSGAFRLKYTYRDENGNVDAGVTTTATFDASDLIWASLDGPVAQQRIKIPEGLRALSNIVGNNIQIFARTILAPVDHAAGKGTRILQLIFTDPAKRGGVWPYVDPNTGTNVPSFYTPEATFEMELEVVDDSLHVDTTVHAASNWIAWTDGWLNSDFFDDSHEVITLSSGQDLRPRKMTNWMTWLAAFMGPWWEEYAMLGGQIDGMYFDLETPSAQPGTMWLSNNSDYGPNGGATAAEDTYFNEFSQQSWYTSIFRPQFDDDTHASFSDGSATQSPGDIVNGWRVSDWSAYSSRAEAHRLLQTGIIDPCKVHFPNIKAFNWQGGYGNNGYNWYGTAGTPKNNGLGSIVGTHQMRDLYASYHYSTAVGERVHRRPNPVHDLSLQPSAQIIKRMQRVSNVTTITCFDSDEIDVTAWRGTLHFFDAMKPGYEIQWRNTRTTNSVAVEPWCPGSSLSWQSTFEVLSVIKDVDGHSYSITVADIGSDADSATVLDPLSVSQQDSNMKIRIIDAWKEFAGRVYYLRMRASSSSYPLAHYYSDINQTDDNLIWLAETMIHARLCGEEYRVSYNSDFDGNYLSFIQDVIDDIDVHLPYADIRPITSNIYTLARNAWEDDFVVSGSTLPNGTIVWRVTLRRPKDNADERLNEPGLRTQTTDYVEFTTMNGNIIRVPGTAVTQDAALPDGWWVTAGGSPVIELAPDFYIDASFDVSDTPTDRGSLGLTINIVGSPSYNDIEQGWKFEKSNGDGFWADLPAGVDYPFTLSTLVKIPDSATGADHTSSFYIKDPDTASEVSVRQRHAQADAFAIVATQNGDYDARSSPDGTQGDGKFHHLVWRCVSSTVRELYVDGVMGRDTKSFVLDSTATRIGISVNPIGTSPDAFAEDDGIFRHAAYWSRALTLTELENLFNALNT